MTIRAGIGRRGPLGIAALAATGALLTLAVVGLHAQLAGLEPAGASVAAAELPLPTATDGEIAVGNLDAQVQSAEERLARAPADGPLRASLVSILLGRGEILGCIADYERAEALAEEGIVLRPDDPAAYRSRASVRAVFHRFGDGLADLARAEALGASPAVLAASRASMLAAQGDLDLALAIIPKNEPSLDATDLASLGLLYAEMGRTTDAARLLRAARARYSDVSPFPLAWMDYREAELLDRRGEGKRACALYARAVALVPRYAAAATHLSAYVGAHERVARLGLVAERADDPEVRAALAVGLRELGKDEEARALTAAAALRYDVLAAQHRAAFADHAARFWLGPGDDPAKAHALAMSSLDVRHTPVALDLALTTALAAKRDGDACELASRLIAAPYADATLQTIARAVARHCETIAESAAVPR